MIAASDKLSRNSSKRALIENHSGTFKVLTWHQSINMPTLFNRPGCHLRRSRDKMGFSPLTMAAPGRVVLDEVVLASDLTFQANQVFDHGTAKGFDDRVFILFDQLLLESCVGLEFG